MSEPRIEITLPREIAIVLFELLRRQKSGLESLTTAMGEPEAVSRLCARLGTELDESSRPDWPEVLRHCRDDLARKWEGEE